MPGVEGLPWFAPPMTELRTEWPGGSQERLPVFHLVGSPSLRLCVRAHLPSHPGDRAYDRFGDLRLRKLRARLTPRMSSSNWNA